MLDNAIISFDISFYDLLWYFVLNGPLRWVYNDVAQVFQGKCSQQGPGKTISDPLIPSFVICCPFSHWGSNFSEEKNEDIDIDKDVV